MREALQRQPIATAATLVAASPLAAATINKSLVHLERIGVAAELTHRRRGRVFAYRRYADTLAADLPDVRLEDWTVAAE